MERRPFETRDRESREQWRSASVTRDFIASVKIQRDEILAGLADAVQLEDANLRENRLAMAGGQIRALNWVLWLFQNESTQTTTREVPR